MEGEAPRNFGLKPDELPDAVPDFMAARFGVANAVLHPRAAEWMERDMAMSELAVALGRLQAIQQGREIGTPQARAIGMNTDAFQDALVDTIRRVVATRYNRTNEHRAIAADIRARDFREIQFPQIEATADLKALGESAEIRHTVNLETRAGESASIGTIAAMLTLSRQLIINDDIAAIESMFNQLAAVAAGREAEAVFSVLENNPTLADGAAMFSAGAGNLLTSSALSLSTLGEAVALLRRQQTLSGEVANNIPAALVVPAEQEVSAMQLVAQLSNDRPPLRVISSPWVAATRWYVTAAPDLAPVVGLILLRDADTAVSINRGPRRIQNDGIPVKVRSDYGATPLGRIGAVRAEA